MKDQVFFPNRKLGCWLPVTAALTLAPCVAIGMLLVYAPLTDQGIRWGILLLLIFIACVGMDASVRLLKDSRIAVIFGDDGLRVVNAKRNFHTYWAWREIRQYRMFSDVFGRHYAVISKDESITCDDNYITRNCSRVLLSDTLAAFIITGDADKRTVEGLMRAGTGADHGRSGK